MVATGSLASSPHIPVNLPCSWLASIMCLIRRNTPGCNGWYKLPIASFIRSTANVYWQRSFVPILKKSTYLARIGDITAAAGTSIMMPTLISLLKSFPSAASSVLHSSSIAFACFTSSTEAIIGYMMWISPNALARNKARNCTLKMSGRFKEIRMAR